MITLQSKIQKILITKVDGLDPISVYLEDIAPGQGKVVIECYCESWCGYWGGIGEQNIIEFLLRANNDYLINRISLYAEEIYDYDEWIIFSRKEVLKKRKNEDIDKDTAHEFWNDLKDISCDDIYNWIQSNDLFPNPYEVSFPMMKNHMYIYLSNILDAVKSALKELS